MTVTVIHFIPLT